MNTLISQIKKIKDLPYGNSFKVLLLAIFIYFCRIYFCKGVDVFIITPFSIDNIRQSTDLDILAGLILALLAFHVTNLVLFKKQRPTLNSILNVLFLVLCYCLVVKYSKVFSFESIGNSSVVTYVDVVFIAFLIFITKFEHYAIKKTFSSINGFIEDDFDSTKNNDFLGRKKYALQISLKILDTQPLNKAFVIAINSPWGYGKSGFLSIIEKFFEKKEFSEFDKDIRVDSTDYTIKQSKQFYHQHTRTIVVKYNPWKNFDDKKTIKNFFEELSSSINKYDSLLSKNVTNYGSYLSKLDDSVFRKIVELTINLFQNDQTLRRLFDEINRSILRIDRKIIIFVDDMDRLTGDELIDILKLIRNTANFKNTFFVVAYDHNYVLNTIEKRKLISNKEEYLQKIVQLEVTLPVFNRNILLAFLDEEIKRYPSLNFYFKDIKIAIDEVSAITYEVNPNLVLDITSFNSENKDHSLIFKVFLNVRDVVRFVNSFKLSFESIGQIGDVFEIILLEFLKIKYLSVYHLIGDKKFLIPQEGVYKFASEEFDLVFSDAERCNSLNIKINDTEIIKRILESIFNSKRIIKFRSIRYPRYFDIYFNHPVLSIISLETIENALQTYDIDIVSKVIDKSKTENTLDDLRNFLESQTDFSNKDDFEIILKALFYLANYDNRD